MIFFEQGTPIFRPRLLFRTFIIHDADIFLHNNQVIQQQQETKETLKMLGHEKYINLKVGLQNVCRVISVHIVLHKVKLQKYLFDFHFTFSVHLGY